MWEVGVELMIIGVIWVLTSFTKSLDKEHFPLKLLFFFLALWFTVLNVHIVRLVVEYAGVVGSIVSVLDTFYLVILWSVSLTTFWFGLYFLRKALLFLLNVWNKKQKQKQGVTG